MSVGLSASVLHRWHTPGGYREFFSIAMPLILSSQLEHTALRRPRISHVAFDQALAAALPAGIANFTFISLFMGRAIRQYVCCPVYGGTSVGACWAGGMAGTYLAAKRVLALIPAYFPRFVRPNWP